jgi:hypothetical protein
MTPIDAVIVILILALPLHWLVLRHFDRLEDSAYLRRQGIVVRSESALQERGDPIGRYMGCVIWRSVTFMGMRYRFDHVIDRRSRENIGPGELFLEPGLVYITD